MRFEKQERAVQRANADLLTAINNALPVGTKVVVSVGRGRARGEISGEARYPDKTIPVEYGSTGRIHRKHIHDIQIEK